MNSNRRHLVILSYIIPFICNTNNEYHSVLLFFLSFFFLLLMLLLLLFKPLPFHCVTGYTLVHRHRNRIVFLQYCVRFIFFFFFWFHFIISFTLLLLPIRYFNNIILSVYIWYHKMEARTRNIHITRTYYIWKKTERKKLQHPKVIEWKWKWREKIWNLCLLG